MAFLFRPHRQGGGREEQERCAGQDQEPQIRFHVHLPVSKTKSLSLPRRTHPATPIYVERIHSGQKFGTSLRKCHATRREPET